MIRNRKKIFTKRSHFIFTEENYQKIIELSNILKISKNKIINKMIETTNSLHFIIQNKKGESEK